MYFNKKIWKLLYLAYRFKKVYTSKFIHLYKTQKTSLPRIFWRKIKILKTTRYVKLRKRMRGKLRLRFKRCKNFRYKNFRYVFTHNGRKIVMKRIRFYKINLFWFIRTKLENIKIKKVKILKKKVLVKKPVVKKLTTKKK